MKKWMPIIAICVLVVAVVFTVVLYLQKSSDLKAANSEIATQKTTISGLNTDLTASKAETADFKTKLTASEAEVATQKSNVADLTTKNTKLTSDLTAANSALSGAQSSLSAAQSANSALTSDLKKVKDPRHFASVAELTDWLQKDDTNTKYASVDNIQRAFILQVRALRDGFLLPVSLYTDSSGHWVGNRAVIGTVIYMVTSTTDSVTAYDVCVAQPSHPEPLP